MLGEIDTEVTTSLAKVRRLVEALRPPALDELGLLRAVRPRAVALAGEMEIEVAGVGSAGPAARRHRDRGLSDRGRGHDKRRTP